MTCTYKAVRVDALGLYRRGLTFYAMRHTFVTMAGELRDQVAVNHVTGHAPPASDVSAVFRERISDDRLRAVPEFVRDWLLGNDAAD